VILPTVSHARGKRKTLACLRFTRFSQFPRHPLLFLAAATAMMARLAGHQQEQDGS
jgi:hypothetical protein